MALFNLFQLGGKTLVKTLKDGRVIKYTKYANGKTKTQVFDDLGKCFLEKNSKINKGVRNVSYSGQYTNDAYGNPMVAEGKWFENIKSWTDNGRRFSLREHGYVNPTTDGKGYCRTFGDNVLTIARSGKEPLRVTGGPSTTFEHCSGLDTSSYIF